MKRPGRFMCLVHSCKTLQEKHETQGRAEKVTLLQVFASDVFGQSTWPKNRHPQRHLLKFGLIGIACLGIAEARLQQESC